MENVAPPPSPLSPPSSPQPMGVKQRIFNSVINTIAIPSALLLPLYGNPVTTFLGAGISIASAYNLQQDKNPKYGSVALRLLCSSLALAFNQQNLFISYIAGVPLVASVGYGALFILHNSKYAYYKIKPFLSCIVVPAAIYTAYYYAAPIAYALGAIQKGSASLYACSALFGMGVLYTAYNWIKDWCEYLFDPIYKSSPPDPSVIRIPGNGDCFYASIIAGLEMMAGNDVRLNERGLAIIDENKVKMLRLAIKAAIDASDHPSAVIIRAADAADDAPDADDKKKKKKKRGKKKKKRGKKKEKQASDDTKAYQDLLKMGSWGSGGFIQFVYEAIGIGVMIKQGDRILDRTQFAPAITIKYNGSTHYDCIRPSGEANIIEQQQAANNALVRLRAFEGRIGEVQNAGAVIA